MAELLHRKRLAGKSKRRHRYDDDDLPNGSMIAFGDDAFAVRRQNLVLWTPSGYSESKSHPCDRDVDVLTPPSMLAVLSRGYHPLRHNSAR
jgi:hypothetical protein